MRNSVFILPLLLLLPVLIQAADQWDTLPGSLKRHVVMLTADEMEGRGLGTEGKVLAKNYIAGCFREIGLQTFDGLDEYFQHFELRISLAIVKATNVVGYLEGSDPALRDEYIVIGAHYDHLGYRPVNGRVVYPGADDNASGTAMLIELARFFAKNPGMMGRSIIFIAFDAEESGLHGSEWFISGNRVVGTENVKLMFSLDMVGMLEANRGIDLRGISTLENGTQLAEKMASAQNLAIRRTTADLPVRTDTYPFGIAGIPSVHIFTGMESPYHSPEDTWDLLDYRGMARITLFMFSFVSRLSGLPELNPSRRFARLQHPWALRFNAGLLGQAGSTYHEYPDDFYRANNVFAFSSGIFFQMHLGYRLTFQQDAMFDYNGSRSPEGTFRRSSLIFPLNLHVNLASSRGIGRFYSITGGYFRHNLRGRDGAEELDFSTTHPGGEWGVNLGFGGEINRIQMATVWRRGITNIAATNGTRIVENGVYFSLGYIF